MCVLKFLSLQECDYLRAVALPRLQISTVVDTKTGKVHWKFIFFWIFILIGHIHRLVLADEVGFKFHLFKWSIVRFSLGIPNFIMYECHINWFNDGRTLLTENTYPMTRKKDEREVYQLEKNTKLQMKEELNPV